jgi:hypothetical protein
MQRHHIRVEQIKYIGKESNSLEDVETGLIHSEQNVYTEYPDPRRNEWQTETLPVLKKIPLKSLVKQCKAKLSRGALVNLRTGRSKPHRKNQEMLALIVKKLAHNTHDPERKR